jgi:hypothetical protein
VNVEYQFAGRRKGNIKLPGTEAIPRTGESVLILEDGEEMEYAVRHVYHVIDEDEIVVQVVLGERIP